jgi:uncharacterized membrane protein YfcA
VVGAGDVVTVVSVAFGAAAQAISGLGFSIVTVPVLTVRYGGSRGVRIANALAIGVNALVLLREGRHADARRALTLLAPATITVLVAAAAIHHMNSNVLSIVAGSVVLLTVVALAFGLRAPALAGNAGAVVAGSVSGAMNVVAGIGGPTVASYASNAEWPPDRLRATLASYFLGLNAVSVIARGVPSLSRGLVLAIAVAVVAGYTAGVAVRDHINARHLQLATLLLAAAGAIAAIIKGAT